MTSTSSFAAGTELLEAGHNHQATIPLSRARDLAPDKTSIREALGRALFHAQRYERAGRRVPGGHRPVADQRLRPVLPRPLPAAPRPPRRGPQATCARRVHAAEPARLPQLPRPGASPRRAPVRASQPIRRGHSTPPRPAQATAACTIRCYPETTAFSAGRFPVVVPEVGARPLFFMSFATEETVNALQH